MRSLCNRLPAFSQSYQKLSSARDVPILLKVTPRMLLSPLEI